MNTSFKEYKETKTKLNNFKIPYFENYKMGNILAMKLYHLKDKKLNSKILKTKSCIMRIVMVLFFDSYKVEFKNKITSNFENEKNFLIMYSVSDNNRKDLKLLFNNIYGLIKNKSDYLSIKNMEKKSFVGLKLKNLKKMLNIYKALSVFENKYERITLTTMIMQILEVKEKTSNIHLNNYKAFITFCDIFEQDNYMVQKFANSNIITITMQHGQTYCKKDNEDNDDLEYENFTADFKLSWGNKTLEEMKKGGICESRIINIGNPKYFGNQRTKLQGVNEQIFGIVLNNKQTINENKKMINHANEICKKFNLKYCIKLHPADDIENYKEDIVNENLIYIYKHENLEEYLKNVYFSIANYSSIYMELFYYYHPTILYLNKFTENVYKDDFNTYRNITQLEDLYYKFIKHLNTYQYKIIEKSHYFIAINGEKILYEFINSL